MNVKKYKNIIFDLDDTLLDFQDTELRALEELFEKYNIAFNKDSISKYQAINKKLWAQLENGLVSKEDVLYGRFEEFFKIYGFDIDGKIADNIFRKHLNLGHKLIPNAKELLNVLKKEGYLIFAATNGVGQTQRQRLKDSRLINFFDDLFISEELGYEKPSIEFFDSIFNKYPSLKKEETIMIGDSLSSDIQGAINFNIDSILFDPLKKDLSNLSTYKVSNLLEIPSILNIE